VLLLAARETRLVLAACLAGKSAAEAVAVMMAIFRRLNPRRHASITLNNGTAFARHGRAIVSKRGKRCRRGWICRRARSSSGRQSSSAL
jgi:IS30 family transposase